MALAHDSDGFLVGQRVQIDKSTFAKGLSIWKAMASDMEAIKKLLSKPQEVNVVAVTPASRASAPRPYNRDPSTLPDRDERGRFMARSAQAVTPVARDVVKNVALETAEEIAKEIAKQYTKADKPEPNRRKNGQFGSGEKNGQPNPKDDSKDDSKGNGLAGLAAREIRDALKDGAADAMHSADQIDPAATAAKEVWEIFSPIRKGFGGLFKGVRTLFGKKDDEKEKAIPWYRRMLDQLKEINEKSGGGKEGGGLLGGMFPSAGKLLAAVGGFMLALPALLSKSIMRIVTSLPGLGGKALRGVIGGGAALVAGAKGGGLLKTVAGAGRAVVDKVGGFFGGKTPSIAEGVAPTVAPSVAAAAPKAGLMSKIGGGLKAAGKSLFAPLNLLLAGGQAAMVESDDSLTREQKTDKHVTNTGENVGAWAGGLMGAKIGAAIGTAIAPGVGTAIGGALGAITGALGGMFGGEKLGEWVNELRKSDIPGKMMETWTSATDSMKSAWSDTVKSVGDWFSEKKAQAGKFFDEKIAKPVSAAADTINKAVVQPAMEKGAAAVKAVNENVVQPVAGKVAAAGQWANENVVQPVGGAVSKAKDWVLGQTSKLFESGKGGAGTVSTGKGDLGGASYGTYQMSSKAGTLQKFLDSSPYGAQFAGLQPGSKEFNDKWKSVASTDKGFGDAQHDFIKTNNFDPQMAKLSKSGIDLSGRGSAVQDAVWSTSTQFGGNTSLIQKALKGKDVSKMNDTDVVSAIQDYKIKNNSDLFKSSSDAVRAGTLSRASSEKDKLVALASTPAAISPSMSAVAATMPAPVDPGVRVPAAGVSVPTPPTAPPQKMNSDSGGSTTVVVQGDIGKTTSDSNIALIANGGLAAYRT